MAPDCQLSGFVEFQDVEIVLDEWSDQKILEIKVRGKRSVGYCRSMPGAVRPFGRLRNRGRPVTDERDDDSADAVQTRLPQPTDRLFPNEFKKMFNRILTSIAERAVTPEPGLGLTAAAFQELTLYGLRPGTDEPDYRPLPQPAAADTAIRQIADGVVELVSGSRLEDDAEDLLWSLVNVFHRKVGRIERELDRNETEQRRLQREQDGSEINDVELQRALVQGQSLLEQQNFYTAMRDLAAEHFQAQSGSVWMPASGSRTASNRTHTAAVIDSRDFIAARRRRRDAALSPDGPAVAFAGGANCQDHDRIWAVLDRAHARLPGMVLMHGGNRKGAELIAAKWAEARSVPQIVFQPDWQLGKAAPFKRNDRMLAAKPIGVIVFPGNGITENLADKARRQGIPVMRGRA